MSMATKAKNAKQRATIAANILKNQQSIKTRCFDDCFEMNDGDQVMDCLIEKSKKDQKLARAILDKCPKLGYGEYNIRLHEAINSIIGL